MDTSTVIYLNFSVELIKKILKVKLKILKVKLKSTTFVNERMKIISLYFPLVIHLHGQDVSLAIPLVLIHVDNEGRK